MKNKQTIWFWDLEETCINSFYSPTYCNVDKLLKYIADNNITEVIILSFAIWYDKELNHFTKTMHTAIEERFGIKIIDVLKADDIRKVVCGRMVAEFDLTDFIALWGKKRSFIEYSSALYKDCTTVLIDDCIPNLTINDHDNNLTIELVDVTRPMRNIC